MSKFEEIFAADVAFPQAVEAYTRAGFDEPCGNEKAKKAGEKQADDEPREVHVIEVDPLTCREVWNDSTLSPAARTMLENVMADPHNFGFVAIEEKTCTIVFRGTKTISDLLKDIQIAPESLRFGQKPGMPEDPRKVHGGFQALYLTLRPSTNTILRSLQDTLNLSLFITGHSLGAALATLCAIDPITQGFASSRIYTFAGPRVGNDKFAEDFDQTIDDCFRIVNMFDVVPHLPIPIPYRHVGKAVLIDGFQLTPDPFEGHFLCGGYLRGLNRLTTVGNRHPIVARD